MATGQRSFKKIICPFYIRWMMTHWRIMNILQINDYLFHDSEDRKLILAQLIFGKKYRLERTVFREKDNLLPGTHKTAKYYRGLQNTGDDLPVFNGITSFNKNNSATWDMGIVHAIVLSLKIKGIIFCFE